MKSATQSWREAASNVFFALSLAAMMGVTLFVTVGVNPKAEGYGNMPWYYAGVCLLTSVLLSLLSRRLDQPLQVEDSLRGPRGE